MTERAACHVAERQPEGRWGRVRINREEIIQEDDHKRAAGWRGSFAKPPLMADRVWVCESEAETATEVPGIYSSAYQTPLRDTTSSCRNSVDSRQIQKQARIPPDSQSVGLALPLRQQSVPSTSSRIGVTLSSRIGMTMSSQLARGGTQRRMLVSQVYTSRNC
ncbi:uncharacterized protein SCHCODRAFT_02340162 [Schizophyllum commune H4-8]|uniref:uncharacterized protein n=1 Tax=Schizophyllum commune (strain H4-8 / FGSC 9210) TaxID=578458 RepID=UPI00215F2FE6|nr:uncharacterized protein SCHCODRAFT_02340162 [Schizophyllum commune H4-8]KAI5890260.1 hypothetical protein SCHCODRAFT_02340162 [Schizophyllum commune H4-8]